MKVGWCSVVLAALFVAALSASFVNGDGDKRVFTNDWAVEVFGGPAVANAIAKKHGFENKGQVANLKNLYHFVLPEHEGKKTALEEKTVKLATEKGVGRAEQQHLKKHVKKSYIAPTDPNWSDQWTLMNTGQTSEPANGRDLNVVRAWIQGVTGCNSVVGVVDDGVQYDHPDLTANYISSIQWDYLDGDSDPYPATFGGELNSHGTSCAGEIGMEKSNGQCGVGVAYQSSITGIRLIDSPGATDIQGANALTHFQDFIQIYSNSWGPSDSGGDVSGPGLAVQMILENINSGREGKGSIYTWAAGNGGEEGDSCAADGYASSIYTIAIGAAWSDGTPASYDEQCSAKMATNFMDSDTLKVTTVDANTQCTSSFDGTSASTPIASGTFALVLEVNPGLTWRDIQYLVVYTSNPNMFVDDGLYITNAAGNKWHPNFGFGALDAEAIVTRARYWTNVPSQLTNSVTIESGSSSVPAGGSTELAFIYSGSITYLEHFVVTMTLQLSDVENNEYYYEYYGYFYGNFYSNRGNISITLTSPSGTVSTLLPERPEDIDVTDGYSDWPFMSVAYWGENPQGEWTLTVSYSGSDGTVTISGVSATAHGTSETPASVSSIPETCHPACAMPQRCYAADSSIYCDSCGDGFLRNATTLECQGSCDLTASNGYCYDDSEPEPVCNRNQAPSATPPRNNPTVNPTSNPTSNPTTDAAPPSAVLGWVLVAITALLASLSY